MPLIYTPDREFNPPETESVNQEEIDRLDKRWGELNQMKWDCWIADKHEKMPAIRRLMNYIENKKEGLK